MQQALQVAIQQLQASSELANDTDFNLEAAILLAHAVNKNRAWLYAWPEHLLEESRQQAFETLIEKRVNGEPVSYLTGTREFWGLPLKVTRDTLIPRPETELLVETALNYVRKKNARVLEMGTGTGAISAALANERPDWQILATDKTAETLKVAQLNLARFSSVTTLTSNWYEQLENQKFDLLISNPPYIETDDPHLQQGDLRFEPRSALAAGKDGLNDIRIITDSCTDFLLTDGFLMLEHGFNQGEAVRQLFSQTGLRNVATLRDLHGHERITLGQR